MTGVYITGEYGYHLHAYWTDDLLGAPGFVPDTLTPLCCSGEHKRVLVSRSWHRATDLCPGFGAVLNPLTVIATPSGGQVFTPVGAGACSPGHPAPTGAIG